MPIDPKASRGLFAAADASRSLLGLTVLLFASCVSLGTGSVSEWTGYWFAPSLSRADTPIKIHILKDGTAIEQIGDYRGRGTWRVAGNTARIDWDTRWIGILRTAPGGRVELATWKAGSPPDGPPDDVQPATRQRLPSGVGRRID